MNPVSKPGFSDRTLARADRMSKSVAVAALLATLSSAEGALVTWECNLVIPATVEGLYIDVVGKQSSVDPGQVPGWAMNLYSVPTPASLSFFISGTNLGYVMDSLSASEVLNLAPGSTVGPSSVFGPNGVDVFAAGGGSGWVLGATNHFGFALDVGGAIRYGYGSMQVGMTSDVRTLLTLVYDDSGAPVTIPAPVPAPGAIGLLAMSGVARSRRRRHP